MLKVAISDWVVARTSDDEMVHGYVDSIVRQQGIAFVHVIASDQEEIIGHDIEVTLHSMKKLPESGLDTEDSVKSLIDLALSIRDEAWFGELSAKLVALQTKENKSGNQTVSPGFFLNRLGVDQL